MRKIGQLKTRRLSVTPILSTSKESKQKMEEIGFSCGEKWYRSMENNGKVFKAFSHVCTTCGEVGPFSSVSKKEVKVVQNKRKTSKPHVPPLTG